jgi:hypothetical protein
LIGNAKSLGRLAKAFSLGAALAFEFACTEGTIDLLPEPPADALAPEAPDAAPCGPMAALKPAAMDAAPASPPMPMPMACGDAGLCPPAMPSMPVPAPCPKMD